MIGAWALPGSSGTVVFYLIDLVRGRFEYPVLRNTVLETAKKHRPDLILIEDASTGTALAQEIQLFAGFWVVAVPPERDKVSRIYIQQAKFAAGKVLFPEVAPYMPDVERELLTFPQGRTDDIVDSICLALTAEKHGVDYGAGYMDVYDVKFW
jgi:predicted phage terminase large subunit-like protein